MRISLDSFRSLLLKTKDIAYRKNIILSVNFMRLGFPDFPLSIIPQLIFDSLGCEELAIQTYSRLDFTNAIYSRYHTPIMPGLSSLSSSAFREDPDKRLLSATHSFVVYGAPSSLYQRKFTSSHDDNSVWEYFLDNSYYWLNIGLSLSETCTFLHYVETRFKNLIEYRQDMKVKVQFYTEFTMDNPQSILYTHFERSLDFSDVDCDWQPLQSDPRLQVFLVNQKPFVSIYPLDKLYSVGSEIIQINPKQKA